MSSAKAREFFDSGMIAFTRADLPGATLAFERSVELDPRNVDAWYYLGMAVLPRDFTRAKVALDRALALSPDHHGVLYWRAEAEWLDGKPGVAARFLRQLNDVAPDAPQNLARQGLAHLSAGETESGRNMLCKAVDAGRGLAGVDAHHPELRRAIYLDLLGRHDEASRLVRSINGGSVSPDLPVARYPHDLEAQRCTLENVVAGRDIIILGSGPSLEELSPLLKALGPDACERLCFFGFNNTPVAERMLQETIGRGVDLACMTSAAVMELHLDWIREFLARTAAPNLFLTLTASIPPDSTLETMLKASPEKLYYFAANADYPPIPEDPLHFPPINTLMCVLPLAVLAQPRRIFLFGCDGVVTLTAQSDAPVYFRQGSADYGKQAAPRTSSYASWLARDTFFFNALIPTVLDAFSVLHRAPIPPIHICNPDSAYRPFPRITTQNFMQMQADTSVTGRFFPARISQMQRRVDRLQAQIDAAATATIRGSIIDAWRPRLGYLRHFAGRVKRFVVTRVMARLRGLARRIR